MRTWNDEVALREVSEIPLARYSHRASELIVQALDPHSGPDGRLLCVTAAAACLRAWRKNALPPPRPSAPSEPGPPEWDDAGDSLLWGAMVYVAEAAAAPEVAGLFIEVAESHLRAWYEHTALLPMEGARRD